MDAQAEQRPDARSGSWPPAFDHLTARLEQRGDVCVLRLVGTIGLLDAEEFRAKLPPLMTDAVRVLVVDLSELSFISSIGLAAIVECYNRGGQRPGSVRLVNPSSQIAGLLRITRVSTFLPVYATVDEAISAPGPSAV